MEDDPKIDPEIEAYIRKSATKLVEQRISIGNRRRSGSQVETFEDVLNRGATEIPEPDQISAAFSALMNQNEGNHVETFEDVLRRGATEIPDADEISAAVSSLMPDTDRDPYASDSNDEDSDQQGGIGGLFRTPLSMAMNTLRFVGSSINERAVQPVAAQVAVHAMPTATAWGKYVVALLQDFTPQRAQNLFRIFANATVNAFGLFQTPSGVSLGNSLKQVADSFVDMVSSPVGRQMVIESSAGVVKLAEALDTPEAKDAIRHFANVVERFIDVLSSDECRSLIHDASEAVCRGIELANSPESTVMAAEITANICYALEVESHHAETRSKASARWSSPKRRTGHRRSASFTSATSYQRTSSRHSRIHSWSNGMGGVSLDGQQGESSNLPPTGAFEEEEGKVTYEDAILNSFHKMPNEHENQKVAEGKDYIDNKNTDGERAVPSDNFIAFPDSVIGELTTVLSDDEEEMDSIEGADQREREQLETARMHERGSEEGEKGAEEWQKQQQQLDSPGSSAKLPTPEPGPAKKTAERKSAGSGKGEMFNRENLTQQFRERRKQSQRIQRQRTSPFARSEKLETTRKRFQEHLETKGRSLNLNEKPKRPEDGGLLCCFMVMAFLLWTFLALYGFKHAAMNLWSQIYLLTSGQQEQSGFPSNNFGATTVSSVQCANGL